MTLFPTRTSRWSILRLLFRSFRATLRIRFWLMAIIGRQIPARSSYFFEVCLCCATTYETHFG